MTRLFSFETKILSGNLVLFPSGCSCYLYVSAHNSLNLASVVHKGKLIWEVLWNNYLFVHINMHIGRISVKSLQMLLYTLVFKNSCESKHLSSFILLNLLSMKTKNKKFRHFFLEKCFNPKSQWYPPQLS